MKYKARIKRIEAKQAQLDPRDKELARLRRKYRAELRRRIINDKSLDGMFDSESLLLDVFPKR